MIAHGKYIGDFSSFYEDSHVQMIIDCMVNRLDNERFYCLDVERTDDRFNDVFLLGVLREGLCKVNSEFPVQGIDEAVVKLGEAEDGSLAQLNGRFIAYPQSGVEERHLGGKKKRNELVHLVDCSDPEYNMFHVEFADVTIVSESDTLTVLGRDLRVLPAGAHREERQGRWKILHAHLRGSHTRRNNPALHRRVYASK